MDPVPGNPRFTHRDVAFGEWARPLFDAAVIAIDGRGGAGKTTLAGRLARHLPAAVAHTDDRAWNHSLFDWDGLVRERILAPAGEPA